MRAIWRFRLVAFMTIAGAALAGADTAVGPVLNLDAGLPAQGYAVAGAFYAGDYGLIYLRVSGAYSPMPASESDTERPLAEREDRGYACGEVIGARFPEGPVALGLGGYYKFGRGVRDYYERKTFDGTESFIEDYVAFKHDAMVTGACRVWTEGKGTSVFWGGAGLSHFRRQGFRYYRYSDYYSPERNYEVTTILDVRLTSLLVGAGVDVRVRFAGPFGAYGAARGVAHIIDFHLEGEDRDQLGASVALTAGVLVGW